MHDNEKWLPVTGFPGYEVSDQGRVRSLDRETPSRWGTPRKVKGQLLAAALVGGSGPTGRYPACVLYRDQKRNQIMVHILVLETFVGPRPAGMVGCHRDDIPTHNHLSNLYWGTQTQNVGDAIRSGRHHTVAQAAKTHCPQGHEYTPENTYTKPGRNSRMCRTCHCEQVKRSYAPTGRIAPTRTHCKRGHAFTEANTYRAPGSPNKRFCRACARERSQARTT